MEYKNKYYKYKEKYYKINEKIISIFNKKKDNYVLEMNKLIDSIEILNNINNEDNIYILVLGIFSSGKTTLIEFIKKTYDKFNYIYHSIDQLLQFSTYEEINSKLFDEISSNNNFIFIESDIKNFELIFKLFENKKLFIINIIVTNNIIYKNKIINKIFLDISNDTKHVVNFFNKNNIKNINYNDLNFDKKKLSDSYFDFLNDPISEIISYYNENNILSDFDKSDKYLNFNVYNINI